MFMTIKSIPLKVDIFQSPDSIFRIILQYYIHSGKIGNPFPTVVELWIDSKINNTLRMIQIISPRPSFVRIRSMKSTNPWDFMEVTSIDASDTWQ